MGKASLTVKLSFPSRIMPSLSPYWVQMAQKKPLLVDPWATDSQNCGLVGQGCHICELSM